MDISTIVSSIQVVIWLVALILWIGRITRGEANMHPWMAKALSSNGLIGIVVALGLAMSAITIWEIHTRTGRFKHIAAAEMEHVEEKPFTNESLELDGKYFFKDKFDNTRIVFRGAKEFAMQGNDFFSQTFFHTDNSQAETYAGMIVSLLLQGGLVNPKQVHFDKDDIVVIGGAATSNYDLDQQWAHYDYKEIGDRHFENEAVPLDGYSYKNSTFANVTFLYNGTAPYSLNNCKFTGTPRFHSGNPSVKATAIFMSELFRITASPPKIEFSPYTAREK